MPACGQTSQPRPQFSIAVKAIPDDSDIILDITLNLTNTAQFTLNYGSVGQFFGIYILGPRGWVLPDPGKARSENWMHQQVAQGQPLVLRTGEPFHVRCKLSEFFDIAEMRNQTNARFQMNVKFYAQSVGMDYPVDTGPMIFQFSN
jgi:hypothetical protein